MVALCGSQPAQAACADGSAGPVCIITNTGTSAAIAGAAGTATVVENSGTISANPAIVQGPSFLLAVNNAAGGVIDGNGGNAIQGNPQLGFSVNNAGTINGNILFNDQPAPNVFTSPLISYVSDGGTLNGNLQLGTSGFSSAYFLQRGADDGVTGTISAGAGLDVYAKSYNQSQAVELGQYALPTTFEIEGFEVVGAATTLTLTGAEGVTKSTINLAGNGNVVNQAKIGLVSTTGSFPSQAEVIPVAIGYRQTNVATYRRFQIPLGQQGSFFTSFYGNALNSFTNNGIVNGDIRLAAAAFTNSGEINLKTRAPGTVIFGAANRDFQFSNNGTINMVDTGARLGQSVVESEFENGTFAAVRVRSALDTTEGKDVRIGNTGDIIGGLDAVVAARTFAFSNSGTIAGLETSGYFSRGVSLNVGALDLVVGEGAEDEFNADSATILNTATGSITHGFSAGLASDATTFENRGTISASGQEDGVALYVENDLLQSEEEDLAGIPSVDATSLAFTNSGTILGSVAWDSDVKTSNFVNDGTVTRALQPFQPNNPPYFGAEYDAFEIQTETNSDQTLVFSNSGTIQNLDRGSSGLTIEVEAGDDSNFGTAPLIASANVRVTNGGTIATTGGATITPLAVITGNPSDQRFLVNPVAALAVDATDVTGSSTITIDNLAGGVISASGTINVVMPDAYVDRGTATNAGSMVAVAATGKVVNITNAGLIQGGAGSDYTVGLGANAIFEDLNLPDRYLAGAIQTSGDNTDLAAGEVYVGSVDHVVNTKTGEIIGSIDLGANDDILENYGSITGNVFLRDGNDTFIQGLNGFLQGIVDGGAGQDTLAFDITGSNGVVNDALRGQFVNFEIETLIGTGTVDTDNEVTIAEGGSLELAEGSNIDVGAGNTAISGSETVGEAVTNSGVITGNVNLGGGDNSLTNRNQIVGNVTAGTGNDRFANSGTITGNIDLGGGNDELLLTGDWTIGGAVDGGAGTDIVQASFPIAPANEADLPILDLSGFQQIEQFNVNGGTGKIGGTATFDEIAINGGLLIGASGSTINANVDVAAGGTFGSAGSVNGNVAIASGGTLSPGASPAVMRVSGNVSLASGSITTFEFVPAPAQSDQLVIDGNLAIASGAVLNLTGNRPLTPGVAYDMIITDNITANGFTIGTWDRTAVQGFLRYTPTRLQLLGTFVAPTGIASQTGATIDYVNRTLVSGEASAALLGAVPSLLDGNGIASATAFGQLNAEAYATASQLGIAHGLSLAKAGRTGATAPGRSQTGLYGFAQSLGDWRTLKGNTGTGVSRATSQSYGVLGGLGYGNESGSIGAFIGYIDSTQRIAALGARTNANGLVAGISGNIARGGFDLSTLVAYDWSDAATRRTVPGNGRVSADYNLRSLVLDASAGYILPVSTNWALRPELGVTHISTRRGGATEAGNAAFALNVDRERSNTTFIDGALSLRGGQAAESMLRPWVQVGVRHQLEGNASVASAGLVGATSRLVVQGAARKETMVTAGAGVSADVLPRLRLFASYLGEFGGGHGSNANVGVRFAF